MYQDLPPSAFQYDLDKSDELWKKAMKANRSNKCFEEMKELVKDPRVCINLQQHFDGSNVQTALDWAIDENYKEMIEWLIDEGKDAWSFRYTQIQFNGRYPNLKQKFDGRKNYQYWNCAMNNKLQDMIEMFKHSYGTISANLIRQGYTPLDFAVKHSNKDMVIHLLNNGGRLCKYTPEQFKEKFPDLWNVTPSGKEEQKNLKQAQSFNLDSLSDLEKKFSNEYPQLFALVDNSTNRQAVLIGIIEHIRNCLEVSTKSIIKDISDKKDREISEIRSNFDKKMSELEEYSTNKAIDLVRETDERIARELDIKLLIFSQKNCIYWTTSEVIEWVRSICPYYEPIAFKHNLVTGRELLTITNSTMICMGIPHGPVMVIRREIERIKKSIVPLIDYKYYKLSNYKALFSTTKGPEYQDEMFSHLRKFIELYCKRKGIHQQEGSDFFFSLQQEMLEKHKKFDRVNSLCVRLWTSAKVLNKIEFCSMLCEFIREDIFESLEIVMPLIKGIINIDPESREYIKWPKNNLLYRGGAITIPLQAQFIEGKKYRCPFLLSTSLKRKIAEMFCNRAVQRKIDSVLYIFHLNEKEGCKCYNVANISSDSNVCSEQEFLFFPYSVFTVRSVEWKETTTVTTPHIIHLDVEVNSDQESEFLPIVEWH